MVQGLDHLLRVRESDTKYSVRLRIYPASGTYELMAASRPIFGGGWESSSDEQQRSHGGGSDDGRALRRARRRVRDLALSNVFDYFVTLTLDKDRVDRYDIDAVGRKLRAWLSNNVQRKGLRYILVPELHKDGAIHFHGFFNAALAAVDSGALTNVPGHNRPVKPRSGAERRRWLDQGAQVVYNLPGWTLGFTTAIRLYGDYSAAVAYICKYIGKDSSKIGGRWYYSGGDLAEPVDMAVDATYREVAEIDGVYLSDLQDLSLSLATVRGKLDGSEILDGLKW